MLLTALLPPLLADADIARTVRAASSRSRSDRSLVVAPGARPAVLAAMALGEEGVNRVAGDDAETAERATVGRKDADAGAASGTPLLVVTATGREAEETALALRSYLPADDVAVMRHGRIVERAVVREIFRKPRHEYTRELLAAVPRLDSLRQEDPFAAVARESEAPAKATAEPVVAVEGLNVVYRNGRRTVHAVHDASLTIAPGEVLGLVGESGSGKSTIAGTLTGLVPIASGSVRVDGVEVAGARRRDLLPVRRSTGVVYQNPASSLNPRRTVGASIAEPMLIHGGFDSPARRARVRELLEAVRLPAAMAERYPHEMSGGQRQRVAIARALALGPRLVIADEPTSALDVSVQAVVLDLLRALQAELGFACLFVSHDLAVVDSIAARTVVLSAGRVVESGPTEQVLARPREDYTRRLVMAVPVPDPAVQAARRERRRALKAVEGVRA